MKTRAVVTRSGKSSGKPRRAPAVLSRNTALHRPLAATLLQPALRVGAVNDPAEREAEAMASRVVASSASTRAVAASPRNDAGGNAADACAYPLAASLRRAGGDQPNLDELSTPSLPAEQQEVEVPAAEDVDTQALDQADTGELDGGIPEDTGGEPPAPDSPPIEDAPPPLAPLRRDASSAVVGRSGGAAPADVASLVAHPGPGRPLPRGVRQRIEPYFGTGFADVRIHDTTADKRAAARVGARAFTHRNRIWLGEGETVTNTRLMAHELTHVVQQTRGSQALPLAREPIIHRFPGEGWLEDKARHIPGYTLMTVLLGRKLITGERVTMTGENLLGGLMGLLPGGTLIFDRLKEARVIQAAFTWVRTRLNELNLTGSRIRGIIDRIPGDLSLTSPFESLKHLFGPVVRDIITFVGEIKDKILEFIIKGALKLAGPYADKVWGVIEKARDTIGMILADPLGFAKNLVKSIVGGFRQFGSNILEHLKKGLLGWLFGSLEKAGVTLPDKLDFKGLISLGLQVLGLTYDNFRKQLVKKLGPKGEKMVSMMEKSVEVVKILVKEGFAGVWQKMLGLIENFKQTLIGGISTLVITSIIKAGISWLAGLSNPVGAIVKVVLAIYDLIVAFIERLEQIMEVAQSIFSSVGAIVRGQVTSAANFIEQTIGRTVPIVISFLAALLGLGGISRKIKDVIKKLQAPVQKAMGKLIGFLVKKAKKFFSKLVAKVNSKRKYPSANFKIGQKQHRIFGEKKGKKIIVKIASDNPKEVQDVELANKAEMKKIQTVDSKDAKKALALAKAIQKQTSNADDETGAEARHIKPDSTQQPNLKSLKAFAAEIAEAAKELEAAGIGTDKNAAISSQSEVALFRAAEPRLMNFEGEFDSHKELKAKAKGPFSTLIPEPISTYYEMDHTIEKRFPKAILENLKQLDPANAKRSEGDVTTTSQRADRAAQYNVALHAKKAKDQNAKGPDAGKATAVKDEGATSFANIGKGDYAKIPKEAPLFPAVAVYHANHVKQKGLKNHTDIIEQARKTGDPHGHLKSSLKSQIDLEEKAMLAQMDADKSAPAKVKDRMKTGIAKARDANISLYALDQTTARPVKDEETHTNAGKDSSSILGFEGGDGAPNFLKVEGIGGEYSKLQRIQGGHLERDHIVDKSYPLNAQKLRFLSDGESDDVEAETDLKLKANNQRMSPSRRARLEALKHAPLYAADTGMAQYSEAGGFAVMLYRAAGKQVTKRVGSAMTQAELATKAGASSSADALADFVISGDAALRDSFVASKHATVAEILRARTEAHIDRVAEVYTQQLKAVPAAHEPAARAIAKLHMTKISAKVHQSLSAARKHTQDLF